MHPKHSLVELGLDPVGCRLEGQRDRTAEGPVAALDNVPILVGVLLVAFSFFSPRMVSNPLAKVSSISFSSTPGNSAVTSMASLDSATSIFGPARLPAAALKANGGRRENSSNTFSTSRNNEPNASSPRPKRDGRDDRAMVTSNVS